MKYILYNPLSKNGDCKNKIESFKNNSEFNIVNVLEDREYDRVLNALTNTDELHIYGGDGTLHHFVNRIKGLKLNCKIYFNTSGTGNDFYHDVALDGDGELILINDYIKNLPKVIVNDREYLFINGVGFGIDGYCCEIGDELQKKSDKPVNYAGIAIKGLLFHFKPRSGRVTVDGQTIEYKKIWICPTLKGKFYGGGMNVTPLQNRLAEDRSVSSAVFHSSGKLKTLTVFPKLFKGTHTTHTDIFTIRTGKHIIVEFDQPTALQIDGETIKNVTKYEVIA